MEEDFKKINNCFTEIRTIENRKMREASKNNEVFDASIINWCLVGEKILYDLFKEQQCSRCRGAINTNHTYGFNCKAKK